MRDYTYFSIIFLNLYKSNIQRKLCIYLKSQYFFPDIPDISDISFFPLAFNSRLVVSNISWKLMETHTDMHGNIYDHDADGKRLTISITMYACMLESNLEYT